MQYEHCPRPVLPIRPLQPQAMEMPHHVQGLRQRVWGLLQQRPRLTETPHGSCQRLPPPPRALAKGVTADPSWYRPRYVCHCLTRDKRKGGSPEPGSASCLGLGFHRSISFLPALPVPRPPHPGTRCLRDVYRQQASEAAMPRPSRRGCQG